MSGQVPTTYREALQAVDPAFRAPILRIPGGVKSGFSLQVARKMNSKPTRTKAGVMVTRRQVTGGGSALVYEPETRRTSSGALIWIFGGGLVTGTAAHVNDVASKFAAELGVLVIAPDYPLAPEHPYPAAIDDCFAALNWIVENAADLHVDPARIAVGGESAGGGLAASVAQRALDSGIKLSKQVLVAPMLDDRTVQRAEAERRVAVAWSTSSNRFGWSSYLGHDLDRDETRPYAVPARREDLSRLAPAWISVGQIDLFHDEVVEYANKLKDAGVPCELHIIPGAHHAFEVLKPKHPAVRELQQARIQSLRDAIAPRP